MADERADDDLDAFVAEATEADRGRIVVVAAGFGLWLGGRCLAAGRWSDVAGIRAYRRPGPNGGQAYIAVRLRDDSEVEMGSGAPGWMEFVSVAPSKLPGMPEPRAWLPALGAPSEPLNETILFERQTRH